MSDSKSKIKLLFHNISYLQYPLLIMVLFFAFKPYINQFQSDQDELNTLLESFNNMMICIGLTISFASLQDTNKLSISFEKKIWENPKKANFFIGLIMFMTFLTLIFGLFGYFITENVTIQEVSIGCIILGIGFLGFLKTAIEVLDNHRIKDE